MLPSNSMNMNIKITADDKRIEAGTNEICAFLKRVDLPVEIVAKKAEKSSLTIEKGKAIIGYSRFSDYYRLLSESLPILRSGKTAETKCEKGAFQSFGVMLDCARNAVPNVDWLKGFIMRVALAGYTYVGMYVEDCLAVENEPHFGYMRGRYTIEEIQEVVSFASLFGIEIVPFVQTLAHLGGIFRHWDPYVRDVHDFGDILLMDNPRTYELIDNIFATIKKAFGKGRVNIGMDEAFMMTLGKYRELHGQTNVQEVFLRHAAAVCDLAKKHGLQIEAWADMFLKCGGEGALPENLALKAWAYSSTQKSEYDKQIDSCKRLTNNVSFGCAVHKWYGYAPLNEFSRQAYLPAFKASQGKIDDFCVTLWGDDGAECPFDAVWYGLMDIAGLVYKRSAAEVSALSQIITGYTMQQLKAFDLPNKVWNGAKTKCANPSKYVLFEDLLTGNADFCVPKAFAPYFTRAKKAMLRLKKRGGDFAVIAEEYYRLCAVLEVKSGMRDELIDMYKNSNTPALKKYTDKLTRLIRLISHFKESVYQTWLQENKSFGIEIQSIRLGGLIERLTFVRQRICDFIDGKINKIDELEQQNLSPKFSGDTFSDARCFNSYEQNVSYCLISHRLYN